MSFMFLTCAWCGAEYTFGIVGRTMVGTARVPFFVVDDMDIRAEHGEFACGDHIGERIVTSTQPSPIEP